MHLPPLVPHATISQVLRKLPMTWCVSGWRIRRQPGGLKENSRWWSEARAQPPVPCPQRMRPGGGARFSRPAGADPFAGGFRWLRSCLASPPA